MIREILLTDYKRLSPLDSTESATEILKTDSFIVIEEENKFFGLLTADDLIFQRKILIGDTLRPKPLLQGTESIQDALDKIVKSGFNALPYVEGEQCIGILTKDIAFSFLFRQVVNENSTVNITNIIGNEKDEASKAEFLKTFCHFSKNHLQVLFSGFKLLEDSSLDTEQKDILSSMFLATKKIDLIMSNYLDEYFHDEMIKTLEKDNI